MKPIVSASIMCADLLKLGEQIELLQQAGVDWLHVDVMDGQFVPNVVIGCPDLVKALKSQTRLPLDVHLMVRTPEQIIPAFAKAGLESDDIIVFHLEATSDPMGAVNQIREHGIRAGIALNPNTRTSALRNLLEHLDMVLLMTVKPGFAGQGFIEEVLPKIEQVRKMIGSRKIDIQVDGGLTPEWIEQSAEAGANVFVGGTSSIFEKEPAGLRPDIAKIVKQIHSIRVNR